MPSARDLLQQADTLMRSNRHVGAADSDEAVPLLTDVAVPGSSGVSHRQRQDEIPVLTNAVTTIPELEPDEPVPSEDLPGRFSVPAPAADASTESGSRARFSATATLRDNTIFPISQMPQPTVQGAILAERPSEPVFSVTAMRAQLAEAGNWDAEMVAPPTAAPTWRAPAVPEFAGSEPITAPALPAAADPAPFAGFAAPAADAAELAETVYYQVLQNLDLYTERALQEHLTTHLSPILERASSELLATLHANLGALMRQYVAEAIEKQLGVRPESSK